MHKLSLKVQSALSLGVVLTLFAILAYVGYASTDKLGGVFTEYRATARQTVNVNLVAEDLYLTRLAALKYRLDPDQQRAQDVHGSVQEILGAGKTLEELFPAGSAELEALIQLQTEAVDYQAAFDEMTALQDKRDVLVAQIHDQGKAIRQQLTTMIGSEIRYGDQAAITGLVSTQEDLLLGRVYFEKFLLTNADDDLAEAKAQLKAAKEKAAAAAGLSKGSGSGAVERIGAEIATYAKQIDDVADIIAKRNVIRNDRLDVIGPKMQKGYQDVIATIVDRQNELGAEGTETVSSTEEFVLLFSLFAVIAATLVAGYIALTQSRSITRIAREMTDMAEGNYDLEIQGVENRTEIGRMIGALKTFRDAGIQRLQLEKKLAEENENSKQLAQRERQERENTERMEQSLKRAVDQLGSGLLRLADGDLTVRLDEPFMETIDQLRTNFNASMAKLREAMQRVGENASVIRSASDEIRSAADDLSRRTEQQAASVEQTAAAVEEVASSVKESAGRAEEAGTLVSRAKTSAEKSGEVVRRAVAAMGQIEQSSQKIGNIIGMIDEIAFQTNLLALNAGVEAARAGDAGRGFAVVAQEVRELAQRTADAAKEIKGLIDTSAQQVRSGSELVSETGKALEVIVVEVQEVNANVTAIVEAVKEQSTTLQEINQAIAEVDKGTQQNAAMVEESTAASHSLAKEAGSLAELLGQFRVGGAGEARGGARPEEASAASAPVRSPARAMMRTVMRTFGSNAQEKSDEWKEF